MKTTTTRKGWALRHKRTAVLFGMKSYPQLHRSRRESLQWFQNTDYRDSWTPVYCTITTTIETRETCRKANKP